VNVNSSDKTIPVSMRSVVRAAYHGRFAGESESGDEPSSLSDCVSPRVDSARYARTPSTSSAARQSQRVKILRLVSQAENQGVDTRCGISSSPYHSEMALADAIAASELTCGT
jgi:hypothetical protein